MQMPEEDKITLEVKPSIRDLNEVGFELSYLESRLVRLRAFLASPEFQNVHSSMQMLLCMQNYAMETYRGILTMREDLLRYQVNIHG
jgi:hypothetical protein